MTTLVVPDTNVLLHFRLFDEVPWSAVVGTDDVVFVVIWPIVRELDNLKVDPRTRDANLVHGDIYDKNVMLTSTGAKLIDLYYHRSLPAVGTGTRGRARADDVRDLADIIRQLLDSCQHTRPSTQLETHE